VPVLPDTAARQGVELIRAAGDAATQTVTIYEEWDRIEKQQAYMAWRSERRADEAHLELMIEQTR
jgi:hypothetical protein